MRLSFSAFVVLMSTTNGEKDSLLAQTVFLPEPIMFYSKSSFLAALQPYKSPCPRWIQEQCKNIFQLFSLLMKTKLVQNVNRMSERQNDMPKDRLTDRQTDRQTERQIEDKTTFQPSYQNKSCSECQQDVRKIERHADRQTERQMDRQTDDRQTERQTDFSA